MRIDKINASSFRPHGSAGRDVEPDGVAPATESRALVALSPIADPSERQAGYRHAPFVAHLIAVKDQHPQTRVRRRAEPDEALAAYRATVALTSY
jgi:hypothetical protein